MRLSTREDIEAPLSYVFGLCSDTAPWERAAIRRGVDVVRTDRLTGTQPGMSWTIAGKWRGKRRRGVLKLVTLDPLHAMVFQGSSESIDLNVEMEFVELSARRSRIILRTDIKPRSLAARLVVQSMKLTRGRIEQKYEAKVSMLCKEIEARYRAEPPR